MANLQLIKILAERRKIPLTELAERIGVSEQQVHLMCRKNSTKIETLERVAKVLQVPVSYFFEDDPKDPMYQQTVEDSHGIVAQQIHNLDNRTVRQEKARVDLTEEIIIPPDSSEEARLIINRLQIEVAGLKSLVAEKTERINELKERIEELKSK